MVAHRFQGRPNDILAAITMSLDLTTNALELIARRHPRAVNLDPHCAVVSSMQAIVAPLASMLYIICCLQISFEVTNQITATRNFLHTSKYIII